MTETQKHENTDRRTTVIGDNVVSILKRTRGSKIKNIDSCYEHSFVCLFLLERTSQVKKEGIPTVIIPYLLGWWLAGYGAIHKLRKRVLGHF